MSETKPTFEDALSELEAIVKNLESGELALEDSLQQFERGVALTRQCLSTLEAAEQKIMILTKENGEIVEKEFDAPGEEQ